MTQVKKTIEFHNTPKFYVEYMRNWLAHKRKEAKANPAEIAIVEDITTLVEVAVDVLDPVPAGPEPKK